MSVAAHLAGRLLSLCVPRLRRVAIENLTRAGFSNPSAIAEEVFDSIGRILTTFLRFPQLTPSNVHKLIEYDGLENFTQAMSKGKGVLVATAHLGNWELSAFAHAWMTAPMNIVVRPLDSPRIDRFVARRRTLSGNTIIDKKDGAQIGRAHV